MADVVCVGDLLIDFVPTVTGTGLVDAPAFQKAAGGAAANANDNASFNCTSTLCQ